ncbi:hypothetical protein [Nocardia sp. NPDC047654]|uniref:hypothetical protein n=1 Tax=Nocardia sp. NPDC047654 TaxID=3364314 RepID=UPI0037239063
MSSRRPPRSPRTPRSPELVARLERSRARSKRRRELARQKERAIQEAVKRYLTDWEAITACETRRDQNIAALRQQISDLEERAGSEIARYRADQAEAAAVIGDHGGSEQDVAELFEISPKLARQLIAAARGARTTTPPQPSSSAAVAATELERVGPTTAQPRTRTPPVADTDDSAESPRSALPMDPLNT